MTSSSAMGSSAATFVVHRKRDAGDTHQPIACDGKYVNADGASVVFDGTQTAKMAFADNVVDCQVQGGRGSKVIFTCGAGSQEGSFSSDCAAFDLGGLAYKRQ